MLTIKSLYVNDLSRVTMPEGDGVHGQVEIIFADPERPAGGIEVIVRAAVALGPQLRFQDAEAALLSKALAAVQAAAQLSDEELQRQRAASIDYLRS